MDLKPGYKQTEIGLIPEDWDVCRLGQTGRVIRGASPRPQGDRRFYGGPIPRLMVEDVTRDGKFVTPIVDSLTIEGAKRSRPCPAGTITIVCSGTVGITSFLAVDACIHDGFLALMDVSEELSADYLFHLLNSQREKFDGSATHGGVFTNLTTKILEDFVVPKPPLIEQHGIAAVLSDADAQIAVIESLIAKKRDIRSGAIQRLVTGKGRLAGFSKSWKIKKLGELHRIKHGKSQRLVEDPNGRYPILATGGQIGKSREPLCRKPSVLIGRKGTIDRPQYMDTPFWSVDTLYYSDMLDGNVAKFLFYRFLLIEWRRYNEASGVPSLSARTIESIEIECPDPTEQQAIVDVLSYMDAEITALEARLKKTRALKQGMMQALLTGRVRLPVRSEALDTLEVAHA